MLLLFAGVASLCLAFVELFVYAFLRSKRATFCMPSDGPTSPRGGKTCSIIKEELTSVISRSSTAESKRRSRLEPHVSNGLNSSTSPRINRFGHVSVSAAATRSNGDILKTNSNGGNVKNGHSNFYQTQALLRKDANKDEDNAHL